MVPARCPSLPVLNVLTRNARPNNFSRARALLGKPSLVSAMRRRPNTAMREQILRLHLQIPTACRKRCAVLPWRRTVAQVESLRSEMDKWEAIAQAEAEYWEARAREEAMAAEEAWP